MRRREGFERARARLIDIRSCARHGPLNLSGLPKKGAACCPIESAAPIFIASVASTVRATRPTAPSKGFKETKAVQVFFF